MFKKVNTLVRVLRLMRTGYASLALGFAAPALFGISTAYAEWKPTGPVRMIVPYTAGGGTDILARIVAQGLSERIGQPVVVENMTGGGTLVATRYMQTQPGDGSVLYFVGSGYTVIPAFVKSADYNPATAFKAVSSVASQLWILVGAPNLPADTIPELIDYMKANPGKVALGVTVRGGGDHLVMEQFAHQNGVEMNVVGYKGGSEAIKDLLGGFIQLKIDVYAPVKSMLDSKQLKSFGVLLKERSKLAPEQPTFAEQGQEGFDINTLSGLLVPSDTPAELVADISEAVQATIADAKIASDLEARGYVPEAMSPDEFAAVLDRSFKFWTEVIESTGIEQVE
jgi:tripartite-type tricarboxylate transporter receptor subunit TctC